MKSKNELPEHEQFRLKAIEHYQMAEMAIEHEPVPIYDQMMANCHFALELIMKALIRKESPHHPQAHDLVILSNYKIRNVKYLHTMIYNAGHILPLWIKICSIWDTDKRYSFIEATPDDFDEYFIAYTRVYKWMLSKF